MGKIGWKPKIPQPVGNAPGKEPPREQALKVRNKKWEHSHDTSKFLLRAYSPGIRLDIRPQGKNLGCGITGLQP